MSIRSSSWPVIVNRAFNSFEDGIGRPKDEVPLFKTKVPISQEFWAYEGVRQQ
jgi:hypothetical protein